MSTRNIVLFVATACSLGMAYAEQRRLGNWELDDGPDEPAMVATTNDSGAMLALACMISKDQCVWTLTTATVCEKGEKHAVLANSDAGAVQLEITCTGSVTSGMHGYIFTNFDQVNTLVKKATHIAFAMPLQSDQFRIVRFQLDGASAAISSLISSVAKRKLPVQRNTLDRIM